MSTLLSTFAWAYKGAVVYDPAVPATSNVASTAAGVLSLLPVAYRPDDPTSLFSRYVGSGRLPIGLSLVDRFNGSVTGSAKCDGECVAWCAAGRKQRTWPRASV